MSWKTLEDQQPELADFGAQRLDGKVAYLATVRKDGSPRVHPMTPILAQGHLFVFMEPTSPKGHDLQRDSRYAIHCSVTDSTGQSGEFSVTGRAHLIKEAELWALAVRWSSYAPADRYVLFEFEVETAASTTYPEHEPVRQFWKRDHGGG
jgi:general stress protein 26